MNDKSLVHNDVAQDSPGLSSVASMDSLIEKNAPEGIHFHFPVTIEVRQSDPAIHVDAIVETTLNRLADSMESE